MPFVAAAGRLSRLTGKPMNVRFGHVYSREALPTSDTLVAISHRCEKSALLHQIRDSPELPSRCETRFCGLFAHNCAIREVAC